MKVFYALLVCLLFNNTLLSQNLEWANTLLYRGRSHDLTIDSENNTYLLGTYSNNIQNTTVTKYNEIGDKCWEKIFNYRIWASTTEEKTCDIYSIVSIMDKTIIGSSSFQKPKSYNSVLLVKTDSAYNVKWVKLLSDSTILKSANIELTNAGVVMRLSVENFLTFKGKVYDRPPISLGHANILHLYLKVEKTNNESNNDWVTTLYSLRGSFSPEQISVDAKGNVYGSFYKHQNDLIINGNSFPINSDYVVKLSSQTGNLENIIEIPSLRVNSITVIPSGKILISGTFAKSFNYKNINFTDSIRSGTCLLMLLENDGTPIWAVKEDNATALSGFVHFYHSKHRNGYIYLGGIIQHGNSGIGGFELDANDNKSSSISFAKIDTLGNVLWAHVVKQPPKSNTFAYSDDLGVDYSGNPIFSGYFSSTISLIDTIINVGIGVHTLVFKVSNFTITRGNIYPGPYCAGDTIEIPFTKKGRFNLGNEFIAQLSDDNGEFIGKERELERLKDTASGVVKGTLPLFNVNTSGKYRIRIVSTSPPVQSFYRQDTLRLLIYSRDSANAGNDTLICQGQNIQLSTTGGSRWQWSPANSLDDSTLFKPIATPTTDTRYRIIISDSSGCGDTDTDYVWVRLRQPLKTKAPFTDTTICRGQIIQLYASGSGGDSTNHIHTWYEKRPLGDVEIGKDTDSILVTSMQDPKTIYTVLTDNCTLKPDTQFYTLQTLPPLSVTIHSSKAASQELKDSLLCFNAPIQLYAKAQGGRVTTHNLQWYANNKLANGDSLLLAPAQPNNYYVVLSDNCTAKPDSAFITLTQRPPLSLITNVNDNLCLFDTTKLQASYSGGDSTQYKFTWQAVNTAWASSQPNTIHVPNSTTTYIATIADNCSPTVKDSSIVNVHPLPTAQFTFDSTYGCPPLQVHYTDKSKGNIPTQNLWFIDNGLGETKTKSSKIFTTTATTIAKLIITNQYGCKDSITKSQKITIFKKPSAQFVVNPSRLEENEPIHFRSTSIGAIKYQWDLGDKTYRYGNGDTTYKYAGNATHTIRLIAENSLGCKDTFYKAIKIYEKVHCAIPSAFTPNGDGLNNTFAPVCTGLGDYTLTIYNRWGQVIFNQKNGAWDGIYADKAVPEGVYMYKIHLHAASKKKSMVYGSVNLIR